MALTTGEKHMKKITTSVLLMGILFGLIITLAVAMSSSEDFVIRGDAPGIGGAYTSSEDYATDVQALPGPIGETLIGDDYAAVATPVGENTLRIVFRGNYTDENDEQHFAESWELIQRFGPHYIRHADFPQVYPRDDYSYLLWTK
jgi:hypothetical protein